MVRIDCTDRNAGAKSTTKAVSHSAVRPPPSRRTMSTLISVTPMPIRQANPLQHEQVLPEQAGQPRQLTRRLQAGKST